MRIVISGYYGFNNNGDDALLKAIIDDIHTNFPNAQITVLSKSPKETRATFGVGAVFRYNPILIWKILKADLVISGGGTLIQDATSTKSLLYYLYIINTAKILKRKVMLYANGIGPLTSFKNIDKTAEILNKVDLITLRDENSLSELLHIGVTKPQIELTADPAFLLEADNKGKEILEYYGVPKDKQILFVSLRKWKDNPRNFEDMMAEFCDYAVEKYDFYPIFVPMQHRVDYTIAASVRDKMKNPAAVIGASYGAETLISIMKESEVCVGMRLHTLIYSANCNVPMIGIVYDPKVDGFLEYMGVNSYIKLDGIDVEKMKKQLDDICDNHDSIKSHIKFNMRRLHEKALSNRELMKDLLMRKK